MLHKHPLPLLNVMDAVNGEGIGTHLDEEEGGAPQDERLVTEWTVLQQSNGVRAKHGEERVHWPHEEAEEPMVMPPPMCAEQLDQEPDQGTEEDEDFHSHQPALGGAPALGKGRGGVLDPHGFSGVCRLSKVRTRVLARGS